MKPIKIALIGNLHDHTPANFGIVSSHPELFEVVGVAEITKRDEEQDWDRYPVYTVDELLAMPELEAVLIEAGKENEVHYAIRFAERGLPIFLDKPGSSSYSKYKQLIEIMKEKKLPLELGYMYRFNPMIKQTLELQKSGKLGELFSVEAQMSIRHDTEKRRWLARYKGGMLYFLGCHLIDLVCTFMGFPEEIIPLSLASGNEGVESEDLGCAVFKYRHGVAYIKTSGSELNGFDRRQLVITGTRGTVEIRPLECVTEDGQFTRAKITLESDNPAPWKDSGKVIDSEMHNRYFAMLRHFAGMVRGECEMIRSYEYELKLFETIVRACGGEDELFRNK